MLEKYLQDIGLSDKESITYLALLQVDNASVLDLSKKTKLNRSTTYVILESLAKKGLVSETTVGKKTHYQAESPERIRTYVERRKIEFQEMEKRLDDVIPQIKSIARDSGERPVVKYFEGKEGIISSAEETFLEKDHGNEPVYLIYPKDLLNDIFSENEREKFRKTRLDKKVKSKVIYTYEKGDVPSDEMGERIKIDSAKYPISCDITIYKDNVRISVLGKSLSSIFIRSKDVAETLRSIFNLAFDKLKENK
jgi:sugar-specific transcriptional regulator TrmB